LTFFRELDIEKQYLLLKRINTNHTSSKRIFRTLKK